MQTIRILQAQLSRWLVGMSWGLLMGGVAAAGGVGVNAAGSCSGGPCLIVAAEGGHEVNTGLDGALRSFVGIEDCSRFEGVTEVFPAHTLQREYAKLIYVRGNGFYKRNAGPINKLAQYYAELQAKYPGLKVKVLAAPGGPKSEASSRNFAAQFAQALAAVKTRTGARVTDIILGEEIFNPSTGNPPTPKMGS